MLSVNIIANTGSLRFRVLYFYYLRIKKENKEKNIDNYMGCRVFLHNLSLYTVGVEEGGVCEARKRDAGTPQP